MSRSQPGQRAATQETRSIRKARYLPALSSSSCSDTNADGDGDDEEDDPSAVPPENPIDPLRRVNVMLQFLGAGAIALGSTLVVSLYVTGIPRLDDMATSSTAVLFMTLLIGCLAIVPSWAAAVLILVQKKPDKGMPPHNPRWLRLSALVAFLLAMLYVIAGVILFVVLEDRASFVSFCLQNVSSATEEDCDERYNRAWLIVLAVGLVLFIHIALGFPVYRYTRGPAYGVQLESGFLLEPGIGGRQRELDRRTLRREPSTSASGLSSESESPERRRVRVHARAGARGPRTERREKALAKGQSSRERRHGVDVDSESEDDSEPEEGPGAAEGDRGQDRVKAARPSRRG